MYVRSLLAQAGLRNEETSPGEDYGAIDIAVHLRPAVVTAQIKTRITPRRNKDETYSVSITAKWCAKWQEQKLPVYLIFVVLSRKDHGKLVIHDDRSTTWHARAYWVQVNDAKSGTIKVPICNRLDFNAFSRWDDDVTRVFTKGVD